MTRSPDSLIPSGAEQSALEKRDDKAFICRQEGEANLRAATQVNAVSASLTPPVSRPTQLELLPGRACVPKAKPATIRNTARSKPSRRVGVSGGGTQRKNIRLTGETLFGPAEATSTGREAYKGGTRKRGNEAEQGVGGGRSTGEARDKRVEGRAATFIKRTEQGKAAGLPPQGKAQPRTRQARRKAPARLDNARKLQRTLYRVAKQQPGRRFTLLYDKVCRRDILQAAWQKVKSNKGAAGVDQVDIDAVRDYGEERFLNEVEQELRSRRYRAALVRRVHIPSPDSRGRLGRWAFRRSPRTAPDHKSHLGWAEISHPFHPLRGQRFEVLKTRRSAGIDTLLLRELDRGSFSIAREWTDWADPSPYHALGLAPRRLDADSLVELATLVEQLSRSEQKS